MLSHVAPYLTPVCDQTEINIEKPTITKEKVIMLWTDLTTEHLI